MKDSESNKEVTEVTSWTHAWVFSHWFQSFTVSVSLPTRRDVLTMRHSQELKFPGAQGAPSTLLTGHEG